MSKSYNIFLITASLSIILLSVTLSLEKYLLINALCIFLILTIGILHGSNDLELHKHQLYLSKKSLIWRLLIYVGIILVILLSFIIFPTLVLYGFIAVSAFHFGEEIVRYKIERLEVRHKIWALSYGFTILFGLFYFHLDIVNVLLIKLNIIPLEKEFTIAILVVCYIIQFQLSLRETSLSKQSVRLFLKEQIEIALILLLFYYTPLLMGFTLFFIFWHSIPSMHSQIKLSFEKVDFRNFLRYLKNSSAIYIISIVGLSILVYYISSEDSLSILITAVTCISVPHILTIASLPSH